MKTSRMGPGTGLIGTDAEMRAETRMWVRRIDLNICEPMANGFRAAEGRGLFQSRMKLVGAEGAADLKVIAQDRILWLDGLMTETPAVCSAHDSTTTSAASAANSVAGWGRALPARSTPFRKFCSRDRGGAGDGAGVADGALMACGA